MTTSSNGDKEKPEDEEEDVASHKTVPGSMRLLADPEEGRIETNLEDCCRNRKKFQGTRLEEDDSAESWDFLCNCDRPGRKNASTSCTTMTRRTAGRIRRSRGVRIMLRTQIRGEAYQRLNK